MVIDASRGDRWGGFGGLYAAKALRRAPVDLTLLDRRNFHLFQPLLYQVATGSLSPGEIAEPLRAVLRDQKMLVSYSAMPSIWMQKSAC